jgi:hypothetical protein
MKKIFLFLIAVFFALSSCTKDESKNPLPTIVGGQFVRLDITKRLLDFPNINTTEFGGKLTTPSKEIVKYDLYVRYTNSFGTTNSSYVLVKSITSFPTDLSISVADLSTALSIPSTSFKKGDKFRFLAFSYDSNGAKIGYNDLSSTVKTQASMKQAYKFVTGLEIVANQVTEYNNYEL